MSRFLPEAERFLKRGKLDDAARALAKAIAYDKNDAAARALLARIAICVDRLDDAEQLLVGLDDQVVLRGALALARGDVDGALAVLADDGNGDGDVMFWRAHALLAAGRTTPARNTMASAASLKPDDAAWQDSLGRFEWAAGRPAAAVAAMKRALVRDRERPSTYVALVDMLAAVDALDAALDVARMGVQVCPTSVPAWQALAGAQLRRGALDGVTDALIRIVQLEPTAEHHLVLATFALANGAVDVAAGTLENLIVAHPRCAEGRRLRAMLIDAADRPEEAIAELRVAAHQAPNDYRPLNDLGALLNTKRNPEAVAILRRAVALAPEEPAPHYNLALALHNAGRRDDVIEAANQMSAQFASDPLTVALVELSAAGA